MSCYSGRDTREMITCTISTVIKLYIVYYMYIANIIWPFSNVHTSSSSYPVLTVEQYTIITTQCCNTTIGIDKQYVGFIYIP